MEQDSASKHSTIRKIAAGPEISAIFVHAGAGYHSRQNAGMHLTACAKQV